jgi:class 3 adenylate cyclase
MADIQTPAPLRDLPPEVQAILTDEIHRGQRNTFIIRLLIAVFGLLSVTQVVEANSPMTIRTTLGAGLVYLLFSVLGLMLVRKRIALAALRYLGVSMDAASVTLVTIASLYNPSGGYEALVLPVAPVLYMMFNMLTALQYSVKLSLFAALMAGLQRTGFLIYCAVRGHVTLSPTSIYSQNALGLDDQITVIAFIVVAGLIAAWVSRTSRRLLLQSAEATVRRRRLEKNQDIFRRYLSPHVRDQALRSPEAPHLGGQRQVAVVLASAIRDFGRLADDLPPEQVVDILNQHFAAMVEIVFRHGGTLDKFTDAGLFAIFGVPNDLPDTAGAAVRAALEMQEAVAEANLHEGGRRPRLRVGIGIAQGLVVAGNVGSKERMEYTVVGKAATASVRLQAMAHNLDADVLVNAAVYDAVRGVYRAERLPADLINAMNLDSAVYRIDHKNALIRSKDASSPSSGDDTGSP